MSRKPLPPRGDGGRFVSAERITTETTRTVTETITLEPEPPARGPSTLPPHLRETPVFWQLLRDPAATLRLAQDFAVDETARALATDPDRTDPFPDPPRPRARRAAPFGRPARPAVPYPELAEETLAGELEPLPHWDMS